MAKVGKKKISKRTNGFKMPDPLPLGEILTDTTSKKWRLGPSIGKGGFGEIYSAQDANKSNSKHPYVIKIEPHENGPLFVEMHFYLRNCKPDDIENFKKKYKLKALGIPAYLGSGSHECGNVKYRFVVTERFGDDVDKLLKNNHGALPTATVYNIALQMVYALEYIHQLGYIHADIKGSNILIGTTTETADQTYLVDFGLATKFSNGKEFKPNPKRAHDGTIEYLSRDAHQGVPTRRGDLEILAYNIVHWLGGKLPWQNNLGDPKIVQQEKEKIFANIPEFLKRALHPNSPPSSLLKFLEYVNNLNFNEEPDYTKIRTWFTAEIKNSKNMSVGSSSSKGVKRRSSSLVQSSQKKEKVENDSSSLNQKNKKTTQRKKLTEKNESQEENLTDAMKEILSLKNKREANKQSKSKQQKQVFTNTEENNFEGYTNEMKEVMLKKMKKEEVCKNKKNGQTLTTSKNNKNARPKRNLAAVDYNERSPRLMK